MKNANEKKGGSTRKDDGGKSSGGNKSGGNRSKTSE